MTRGKLITIEGLDGAGKTTVAAGLLDELHGRGVAIELMREPGGVAAAERIRELVKDPELAVSARTEALMYAAARAQLVDEALAPALAGGRHVLLDRFVDSSLAYQGGGRQLGVEAIRAINAFATQGLRPDLTLLLAVPPSLGRSRADARGMPADRLEREREPFFARIAATYAELAAAEPARIRVIDATRPPDEVLAAASAAVAVLL